jgi:ribosomal protein S1
MEALLVKYGGGVKALERGQKIQGKIISKSSKRLVLNINRKSEGLVAEKAFNEARDYIKGLKVGDKITTSVIIPETTDGYTILSLREAKQDAAWEKLLKTRKEKGQIIVLGKSVTSAGAIVEFEGLIGFIPNSQLGKEVLKNPKELIGEHFKAKILEADRDNKKIVLSEKEVSEAEDIKLIKKAIKKIKEGEIYQGRISAVMDFGCFISILVAVDKKSKISVEGLVHISELSWDKIEDIREVYKEGDKVKVKVIGKDKGKLALSTKQAQEDPWDKIEKKYKVDSKKKGKVIRHSDFGVFVRLEPGVEGLVHITKIPPGTKIERGQEVNVYVEEVDRKNRRLSLGLVLTAKPVGYK